MRDTRFSVHSYAVRIVMLLVLLFTSPAFAGVSSLSDAELESKIKEVAASKHWRNLLHYKRAVPFSWQRGWGIGSQIDGDSFFFSQRGADDAEDELRETVKAFSESRSIGKLKQHPQCAFPERYRFLKSQLQLAIKDTPCPDLERFLALFRAKSVSLIFSSAYPNNPGSMFGHTFLNFVSGTRPEILDYTISYAAFVGPDAGLAYMAKGVFGGYPGSFSMLPYYVKINDYANSESRDIIEYHLSLSEGEVQSLLRHLWEVEANSLTRYYFFDENCASMILDVIEAVRPDITFHHSPFFVTPGESVRSVVEVPGLVASVLSRPSLARKLDLARSHLDKNETKQLYQAFDGTIEAQSVDQPQLLDTVNLYHQYIKQKQKGTFTAQQNQRADAFLLRRSEVSGDTVPIIVPEADVARLRPDRAHRAQRLSLLGGEVNGASYFDLAFRFSLHDLLDDDEGYVPFSHIDLLSASMRWYKDDRHPALEQLTVFSVTSLFPLNRIERRPSWKVTLDLRRPKDYGCLDCQVIHLDGGGGATLAIYENKWLVTALASIEAEVGIDGTSGLRKGYRLMPVVTLATIANPVSSYKINFAADGLYDAFQYEKPLFSTRLRVQQAWTFVKNWRIHGNLSWTLPSNSRAQDVREGVLGFGYYF